MGSGLSREELFEVLRRATSEGGTTPAVRLLHETGTVLQTLDEAGWIEVLPPHPDDPEQNPHARIDWAAALADHDRFGWGRDRHLLSLAASLAGAVEVDLRSALGQLDRRTTAFVLAAISDSTQAHTLFFEPLLPDGRPSGRSAMTWQGPLYAWPGEPSPPPQGQGTLALWPAAEEEAAALAAAFANPYPEVSLPLDDHVLRVLRHLRPATLGRRRRERPDAPGVGASMHDLPRADVETWLGFALPEFADLAPARLVCLRREPGPLPHRGSPRPNGEPSSVHVVLLWVAPDVDLDRLVLRRGDGILRGTVTRRSRGPVLDAEGPATLFTNPAGGHTTVTVGGTRVAVQHVDPGLTRTAWGRDAGGDEVTVALHVPHEPRQALELLLRGRDAP